MAENIELAKFSFNVDEVVKNAAKLKEEIQKAKDELVRLEYTSGKLSTEYVQQEAKIKALNSEYGRHIKAINEASQATKDQEQRESQLAIALDSQATSIAEAREQNKLLNKLRNETNVTTEKGQEEIRLLNEQLDKNNALIKENADSYLKQKINIGNYSESIKDALKDVNLFNGGITNIQQNLTVFIQKAEQSGGVLTFLGNSLKTVVAGIYQMIKASLAFLATPIGAVIGALGLALGLIINYLKSTQSGIDKVTAVTRPLSAIFQSLIGVLQKLGEFLFKAFSEPKKVIEDVYNYVKDKVIKQFQALSKVVEGIFTLNFGKLKEGFKELADNAKSVLTDVGNVGKAVGKFFEDAIENGKRIDELQKQIEQGENDLILLRAINNKQIKEAELIAKDRNRTEAERKVALEEALRLTEEITKAETLLLDKKIEQKEIQNSLNDTTREDEKALNELIAQRADKEAEDAQTKLRFLGVQNQLTQEANKKAEEATSKRIEAQKQELDLFIAQQGTRARTLEDGLKLERELSEKRKSILEAELKANKITQTQYNTQLIIEKEELLRKEAELTVENARRELELFTQNLEKQREAKTFLSEQEAVRRQAENDRLLQEQDAFAQLQLEKGLINQDEYDDAINLAKENNRLENEAIQLEREQIAKEEQAELRALEFENELALLEEQGATKFALQQAIADEQRQIEQDNLLEEFNNKLISQELYEAKKAQIDQKFKKAELDREKILAEQRLKTIGNTLGQVSQLLGKNSEAGKAAAVAQAVINTWQGVSEIWKTPSVLPEPFATVQRGVSTGVELASGFQAIKNIQQVDTKSASPTLGSTPSAPKLDTGFQNISGANVNLSQIAGSGNASVQNQIEQQGTLAGADIAEAVEMGASRGTERGSAEGITNLSDNRQIQRASTF